MPYLPFMEALFGICERCSECCDNIFNNSTPMKAMSLHKSRKLYVKDILVSVMTVPGLLSSCKLSGRFELLKFILSNLSFYLMFEQTG